MWFLWASTVCLVLVTATPHLQRDSYRRTSNYPASNVVGGGWQKRLAQAIDDQQDFQPQQLIPSQLETTDSQRLMLRSPRGQRQYDVPQIGKSIQLFFSSSFAFVNVNVLRNTFSGCSPLVTNFIKKTRRRD